MRGRSWGMKEHHELHNSGSFQRDLGNLTCFPNLFTFLLHCLFPGTNQQKDGFDEIVCRRHCREYCISQGTLSSFLPCQYWAFFSEPAPCHLSNIKSQALLCTAGAFVTAQPLTVLSICLIMTFLFASNLPQLLFLSCNSQGMRSLYQFPLNGACVLCKTAWAWYGATV